MATNVYTKITDLDRLNSPYKSDDLFIISRPNGSGNRTYESYQATYSELSGDIESKVYTKIIERIPVLTSFQTVNRLSDVRQNGERLVKENAVYEISQRTSSSTNNNYLDKTSTSLQTITGPIFINNNLSVKSDPTEDQEVATKRYVDQSIDGNDIPVFITGAGADNLSSFIITGSESQDDISQGLIYRSKSNPVVVYVPNDCILQIIITEKSGTDVYGVFTYDVDDSNGANYNTVRNNLINIFKDKENLTKDAPQLHIIDIIYSKTFCCSNVPIKGGTYVCVSPGISTTTERAQINYQKVDKNYKAHGNSKANNTDPKSCTDSYGYYFHWKKNGNKYVKEYDLDSNGQKYKKYITVPKTIRYVGIKTSSEKFAKDQYIMFNYFE